MTQFYNDYSRPAMSNFDQAQLKYKISRMLDWLDGRNAPLPPRYDYNLLKW